MKFLSTIILIAVTIFALQAMCFSQHSILFQHNPAMGYNNPCGLSKDSSGEHRYAKELIHVTFKSNPFPDTSCNDCTILFSSNDCKTDYNNLKTQLQILDSVYGDVTYRKRLSDINPIEASYLISFPDTVCIDSAITFLNNIDSVQYAFYASQPSILTGVPNENSMDFGQFDGNNLIWTK